MPLTTALHTSGAALTDWFGGQVIVGRIVSCTWTAWVWMLLLPWLSANVQVIVKSPWPNGPDISGVQMMVPSQLSVAVGGAGKVAEHCSFTSGRLPTFG